MAATINKRTPRAKRPIRDSTFLDDPAAYPEFAGLTRNLAKLHAFRWGLHKHRTAALVLFVATCMAISGVPVPPSGTTDPMVWLEYCKAAVDTNRLVAHFEGFPTAFATMIVIALLSILVHPVYMMVRANTATPTAASSSGQYVSSCFPSELSNRAVVVGVPMAAVWVVAIWAKSQYTWGLASGLWVGLFCACVTLKVTSFAASTSAFSASTPTTTATSLDGDDKTIGRSGVTTSPAAVGAPTQENPTVTPMLLTFGEFLFFMFLSPSLVCEIHLMKASARRPSRPLRAASEFFHALLAFLTAHCVVGSIMAPSLRLVITDLRPEWVEGAATGWAELNAAGGGGWPAWATANAMSEGENGVWVTVAAFLWILVFVSSCLNFLVFYAFWHCVCLGIAELWGFPDRHLYGPWWLNFDDPREFLRMWSVPVHRWLSACVYWPMLEAAAVDAPSQTEENGNGRNGHAEGDGVEDTNVSKDTDKPPPPSSKRAGFPAVLTTFIVSAVFHEAVVYVAMRGSVWPFNTFLLTVGATLVMSWDNVFPPPKHGSSLILSTVSSSDARGGSCRGDDAVAIAGTKGAAGVTVGAYRGRGVAAVLAFGVLTQLSLFICDVAAWLWWRHVLMT